MVLGGVVQSRGGFGASSHSVASQYVSPLGVGSGAEGPSRKGAGEVQERSRSRRGAGVGERGEGVVQRQEEERSRGRNMRGEGEVQRQEEERGMG